MSNITKGLKLIGKGAFTKCYKKDNKTVLLRSIDPIKECMAHGWFPESRLFPKVSFSSDNEYGLYEMDYYPRVKSLKKSLKPLHWKYYKELKSLFDDKAWDSSYHSLNLSQTSEYWLESFKNLKNRRLRKVMIEAINSCRNYGDDIAFEISPRNVSVSKTGCLVLMDCFFSRCKLRQVRTY